jgi:hypothetical protein
VNEEEGKLSSFVARREARIGGREVRNRRAKVTGDDGHYEVRHWLGPPTKSRKMFHIPCIPLLLMTIDDLALAFVFAFIFCFLLASAPQAASRWAP